MTDSNKMLRAMQICKAAALNEDIVNTNPAEAKSEQERLAAAVADRITSLIFTNRQHAHALREVIYNKENNSLLFIMHPIANDYFDEIVKDLEDMEDVKQLSDNIIKDDVEGTEFHVLKVKFQLEDDEEEDEEGVYDITPDAEEEEPETPVMGPDDGQFGEPEGPDFSGRE